jgi:tetratricopeptide (TPR) repeat protein
VLLLLPAAIACAESPPASLPSASRAAARAKPASSPPASRAAAHAKPASAAAAEASAAEPLADWLAQGKYAQGLEWLGAHGKSTVEHDRYRGLFHHGLGQPDAVLKYLVPVYRARPSDDAVALALAEASLWKKDYKTALQLIDQLQAKDAPEALRVRGMVLEQAGRLPEALALYERAIPRLALPWGALERKAQVLSWLKRFEEASATYAKVAASAQASIELRRRCRVRMAEITAWQKDFPGALAQLDTLLAEEPRLIDALLLRGQILEWQGEFAQAKRAYSRVLAIDAGQRQARLRLDKLLWVE